MIIEDDKLITDEGQALNIPVVMRSYFDELCKKHDLKEEEIMFGIFDGKLQLYKYMEYNCPEWQTIREYDV